VNRETEYAELLAEYRAALATGRIRPPSPPHIDMSDLAKALRRAWWRAGAAGHYPTCPCKACVIRVTPSP